MKANTIGKGDLKDPKMTQLHLMKTSDEASILVERVQKEKGFDAGVAGTHQLTSPPNANSMALGNLLLIARNVAYFEISFDILMGKVKNSAVTLSTPLTGTLASTASFYPSHPNRTVGMTAIAVHAKLDELRKEMETGSLRQLKDTDNPTPDQAQ